MKRKTVVIGLVLIACMLLAFAGGVYVGLRLHRFDFLCVVEPEPSQVTIDLHGEYGMLIPAGTIVARYSCEYADRFSIEYVLPHGVYTGEPPLFETYVPASAEDSLALKRGTLYQYEVTPQQQDNRTQDQ